MQRKTSGGPAPADEADTQLWDDMFALARKRIAAKDFAGAEELLRRCYTDPKFTTTDNPGVVLNLALARHWQGGYREAMALYEEVVGSADWDADARRSIVENIRAARLQQPPRTSGGPAPADEADTQLWDDMFALARKRIAAKDFAGAEELLRRCYTDPKFTTTDNPGVVLNLALARHWQGGYREAMALYEEVMGSSDWDAGARRSIVENIRAARLQQPPRIG